MKILGIFIIALLIAGCTANPFWNDDTSSSYRSVKGRVELHDGSVPGGVYIWLEGFEQGAYSAADGEFILNLPAPSSQGGGAGLSGVFTLYAYLANYYLATAQVVLREGEILPSRGDVTKDGRIGVPLILRRFLRITTEMEPSSVFLSHTGQIQVKVNLTAVDSATVILPKSVGGALGAVFLRRTDTGEVTIIPYSELMGGSLPIIVGRVTREVSMAFSLVNFAVGVGNYEAIPYLYIAHQQLPDGLLSSLGSGVMQMNLNYLKIPFRREGGSFQVKSL